MKSNLMCLTKKISWKRGSKRNGKTDYSVIQDGKIIWKNTFKFTGTLYKMKKGGYDKKKIHFTLESVCIFKLTIVVLMILLVD